MVILQEFGLEIQLMKLVRGQGLTKKIENNEIRAYNERKIDNEEQIIVSQVDINERIIANVWYQDIVFYLL